MESVNAISFISAELPSELHTPSGRSSLKVCWKFRSEIFLGAGNFFTRSTHKMLILS